MFIHLVPENPEHTRAREEKARCWEGFGVDIQSGVGAGGNGAMVR